MPHGRPSESEQELADERVDFLEALRDVEQQGGAMEGEAEERLRLLDRISNDKIASFIRFCYEMDAAGLSTKSFESSVMQVEFELAERQGVAEMKHVLMCLDLMWKEARQVIPESLLVRRGGPCGRRINPKELEYKCLDCGLDPTSIMCVDCFQRSPCVNHNYRLITGRGGCCDCGDPEAWKAESFCCHHACNGERIDHDFQNALSLETKPEVQQAICAIERIFDVALKIVSAGLTYTGGRSTSVFGSTSQTECDAVLRWVVGTLKDDYVCQNAVVHSLLKDMRESEEEEEYTLLEHFLVNFYSVPEMLRRSLFDLVHSLLVISRFKRNFALIFAKLYVQLVRQRSQSDLASKKIESGQDIISLSIQTFSSRQLMKDMLDYNFKYCHLDSSVYVRGNVLNSIFDWVLISLKRIAPLHKVVSEGFLMSRHEIFQDECIDSDQLPRGYMEKVFIDLQLIFRHDFTCRLLMDSAHHGHQENPGTFLGCFTKILRMLQGAEPVFRRYGEHVRFEQRSWFPVLILSSVALGILDISLTNLSNQPHYRSMSQCQGDFLDVCGFLRSLHRELHDWFLRRGMSDMLKGLDMMGRGELKFRSSTHSTSLYLTLHRAIARILIETTKCAKLKSCWCSKRPAALMETLLGEKLEPGYLRCLIEHPLRIQALVAQVNSLMWVRNGFSLQNHVAFYHSTTFSWRGRDLDLLLLQLGFSSISDGDFLLKHLVNTFEVGSVALLDAVSPPLTDERMNITGTSDPGSAEQRVLVLEEMLQLLISLTSSCEYLGDLTDEQQLQDCILHCLAVEDRSHSEIQDWVEQSLLSFMFRRFVAGEIDRVLSLVATRSQRPTDGVEVYRLLDSCWPKININSFYFRTRKERYSAEIRLFNHYRSNSSEYRFQDQLPACRPPWLAPRQACLFAPVRKGLRAALQASRLYRLIFIILHNAACAFSEFGSFSGGAKWHRKRKKDDSHGAAEGLQQDSKVVARSSEMALRHCLNLLFLAVISEGQEGENEEEEKEQGGPEEKELEQAPPRDAGGSSCTAGLFSCSSRSWQRRAAGVEVRTDELRPGQGLVMMVEDGGIVASSYEVNSPACSSATLNTPTESYYNSLHLPKGGKLRDLDVNTTGLEDLFVSEDPKLKKERNVFESACKEYVIEGDAGFEDTSNVFLRRVSHVRLHAVSHKASILSLLIHLARVAPAEGSHLLRESILSLLRMLSSAHENCRRVIESSRIFEAAAAESDEAEVARKREEVARRKEKIMEEMRKQQLAAAAQHNLMSDEESSENQGGGEMTGGCYSDPLAKIEGDECSLCQESMAALDATWSRKEPSTDTWIPYDETTSRELERADLEGMESVEIFVGGEIVVVDLKRRRQSAPLCMGRSSGGKVRELPIRREESMVVIIGYARPAAVLLEAFEGAARPVTISSCGHAVHSGCLERYASTLQGRRNVIVHGQTYENANSIDMAAGEFLCPICRRISNLTIPLPSPTDTAMLDYLASLEGSGSTGGAEGSGQEERRSDGRAILRQATIANELLLSDLQRVNPEGAWKCHEGRARKLLSLFVHQVEMREMITRLDQGKSQSEKKCGHEGSQASHALLLCAIRKHVLAACLLSAEEGARKGAEEGARSEASTSWLDVLKGWTLESRQVAGTEVVCGPLASSLSSGNVSSLFASVCLLLLSLDLESLSNDSDGQLLRVLIRKCALVHSRFYSLLLFLLVGKGFPTCVSESGWASLPQLLHELEQLPPPALQELLQEISSSSHVHPEAHCKELVRKDWQQAVTSFRDLVAYQSFVLVRRMLFLFELLGFDVQTMLLGGQEASASSWKDSMELMSRALDLPPLCSADIPMGTGGEKGGGEEDATRLMGSILEMVGQGGRKQTIQRLFLRNIQRGLVTLPPLFQDLVRDVYESEGGGGETVSQVAVCLVCGEKIARISSGSVLSYRPCVSHARSCGAGLGIFLLLSKSSVMLVQDLWVAHWGSPFLDQYGEEDFGLLRGHKLFLDAARYSSLNELWNSQNLRRWNANKWKKVEAIP